MRLRKLFFVLGLILSCDVSSQSKQSAKLAYDSIHQTTTYQYRSNKVKQVIQKEKDFRAVMDIDRLGNEVKNTTWYEGTLAWISEYSYDEYGYCNRYVSTWYDDEGSVESVRIDTSTFESVDSGRSERCIRTESVRTYYEYGAPKDTFVIITRFEYDSAGFLVKTIESGELDYCYGGPKFYESIVTSTYSLAGQEITRTINFKGGCDNGYVTRCTYTYSSDGRIMDSTCEKDGKPNSQTTYEYNGKGQDVGYISKNQGELSVELRYRYYRNGLEKTCRSNFWGDKGTERSRYVYY